MFSCLVVSHIWKSSKQFEAKKTQTKHNNSQTQKNEETMKKHEKHVFHVWFCSQFFQMFVFMFAFSNFVLCLLVDNWTSSEQLTDSFCQQLRIDFQESAIHLMNSMLYSVMYVYLLVHLRPKFDSRIKLFRICFRHFWVYVSYMFIISQFSMVF